MTRRPRPLVPIVGAAVLLAAVIAFALFAGGSASGSDVEGAVQADYNARAGAGVRVDRVECEDTGEDAWRCEAHFVAEPQDELADRSAWITTLAVRRVGDHYEWDETGTHVAP